MTIKLLLILFFAFVISRVILRFRDGHITIRELATLCLFWIGAAVVVLWPNISTLLAQLLHVGRGADAVLYLTVAALCYLQFRTYIHFRDTEQHLTELVRKLALRDAEDSVTPKPPGQS